MFIQTDMFSDAQIAADLNKISSTPTKVEVQDIIINDVSFLQQNKAKLILLIIIGLIFLAFTVSDMCGNIFIVNPQPVYIK